MNVRSEGENVWMTSFFSPFATLSRTLLLLQPSCYCRAIYMALSQQQSNLAGILTVGEDHERGELFSKTPSNQRPSTASDRQDWDEIFVGNLHFPIEAQKSRIKSIGDKKIRNLKFCTAQQKPSLVILTFQHTPTSPPPILTRKTR